MQEQTGPATWTGLLAANIATMDALDVLLSRHTDDGLTTARDSSGWTAKDHLAHLTAWYRSVLYPVRDGISRSRALGMSEAVFASRGEDDVVALNEAIRRMRADEPLDDVVRGLHEVFAQIQDVIAGASDADLLRGTEACDPAAGAMSIFQVMTDDGWRHLDEHRGDIEAMLGGQ